MDHIPDYEIVEIIDRIESGFLQLNKQDLSVLAQIMSLLSELSSNKKLSGYLRNVALRAAKLSETIILDDVHFESGCKRLKEAVSRIKRYLHQSGSDVLIEENTNCIAITKNNEQEDSTNVVRIPVLEDALDLVDRFIASQQTVLEDLEEKALSLENGSSDELSSIKRLLHTMKGEFGVLNLQSYTSLIHQVEAAIERNEFTTENVLRLKDVIGKKLAQYSDKSFPDIKDVEREYIFGEAKINKSEKIKTEEKDNGEISKTEKIGCNADPSLICDFINESRDHIHNAETLLLEMESNHGTNENLNSIFRSCHTIKGVAGFLGLKEIASFAHAMESLMDLARQGEIILNTEYIDLLINAIDCLKEFIGNIENAGNAGECNVPESYTPLLQKLDNAVSSGIRDDNSRRKMLGEILIEKGEITEKNLHDALKQQDEGDSRKIGQILVEENNISEKKVTEALLQQNGSKTTKAIEETIKVPVNRLDQLIDAIGEAVIAQSMITADPVIKNAFNQGLQTKINQANMIMRQIQQLSMSLRMVSVKATFQKMARLVRDLSKKSEKQVQLITEGEDTEIDKTVVEHIGDPLIHMIRNSMDHGIETSAERIKKGKTPNASIILKAYHKAGSVFIEISDNGRGLDRDAILNKAVERGLCKDGDRLSDQDIYNFIFQPGFSTAKQITDISGRGVGMDVVKKNVDALRGSVEINTEKDRGTTFTIRLPLTLAIIDGMIVKVNEALYIVPTLSIIETIAAKEELIESIFGERKMIKVRENNLPLLYLSQLFDNRIIENSQSVALIVEDTTGKRAAIMVDEIIGQQQVVIKSLGNGVVNVPGITGGAIMSDGAVSLILDINGIIKNIMDK